MEVKVGGGRAPSAAPHGGAAHGASLTPARTCSPPEKSPGPHPTPTGFCMQGAGGKLALTTPAVMGMAGTQQAPLRAPPQPAEPQLPPPRSPCARSGPGREGGDDQPRGDGDGGHRAAAGGGARRCEDGVCHAQVRAWSRWAPGVGCAGWGEGEAGGRGGFLRPVAAAVQARCAPGALPSTAPAVGHAARQWHVTHSSPRRLHPPCPPPLQQVHGRDAAAPHRRLCADQGGATAQNPPCAQA